MIVVFGEVIGDAALARVDVAAAKVFRRDDLAGRGFDERRAAEEDRTLPADDDRLVRHRRNIGAASRAGAVDDGDLRDARRGHVRLIVEDAAEIVLVRKNFVLHRQERAARFDEIDARKAVFRRNLLRAQMLLHRHRMIGAAFDRRVIGDDHAFDACNAPYAGDNARAVDVA